MKYWFDCEFDEDGRSIELISIGIVSEDQRSLYRVSSEFDPTRCDDWVKANVIAKLPSPFDGVLVKTKAEIARDILEFFDGDTTPMEMWSYFGHYDWVVFCQIFGKMVHLPDGVPQFCYDLKQLRAQKGHPKLPEHPGRQHVAIDDASWHRLIYLALAPLSYTDGLSSRSDSL